jgi:hypothetical protein
VKELDQWVQRQQWREQNARALLQREAVKRRRRRPRGTKLVGRDDIPVPYSEGRLPPSKTQRPQPTDITGRVITRIIGKGKYALKLQVRR